MFLNVVTLVMSVVPSSAVPPVVDVKYQHLQILNMCKIYILHITLFIEYFSIYFINYIYKLDVIGQYMLPCC